MHLVLLGPPGAGKGTQAALLSRERDLVHISTGDMLRGAVREGTELGRLAKQYMDQGNLVPNEVVIGITRERLQASDVRGGFILDGFPRTVKQAEALDEILEDLGLPLEIVLNLDVPEVELVRRMTGRRTCPNCGESYHLVFNPPKSLGVCDRCSSDLAQRDDDKEATVRQRLEVYRRESDPLVGYYENSGILVTVDGRGTVEQVQLAIQRALR